ncbi:7-carboxy-7-deazaguanine synthase [Halomonas binhaiensis]|uniref:7-carboxy-7-deazaguanine synthase n=1 Tax=Halomonas binhaiensis TaxID=2562282 RepID=A0A5C1NGG3_9GAMM|nr:7-carboxy-7-deazaguanine synthase [Halomonas binhaiensis]QEM81980.1 7-carboxy-7-deazaguanine synthase [Halomonas binhaiensis]
MYSVKEAFYTLQGEGAQSGRASVFCRFSGCNLWSGREQDRAKAQCQFCDTDFVGTDGQNGGKFADAGDLADHLLSLWQPVEKTSPAAPYVVFTGGEPLLQLDEALIDAMHQRGFDVGVETNGTLPAPPGIDWLCVSPKGSATIVQTHGNELKLVFPQADAPPQRFENMAFEHFLLQPMDKSHQPVEKSHQPDTASMIIGSGSELSPMAACVAHCLAYPQWRLSLQTHKILGID